MKDTFAWQQGKNLFAFLLLAAFLPVLTGCQHGPYKERSLTISHTAPYEADIQVRRAVRKECELEQRVAQKISSQLRGQFSEIKGAPAVNADTPGLALDMKIINVEGGIGAARGHKTLTVAGTLYEDGKLAGNFVATRRTNRGHRTCRMLWENIEEIAEDVSRWMVAPRRDAYLGDARPGDFFSSPPSKSALPPQDI